MSLMSVEELNQELFFDDGEGFVAHVDLSGFVYEYGSVCVAVKRHTQIRV